MLSSLARLFQIKSRLEVWPVIWAIATGAVERGVHYLQQMHGWLGWIFFFACVAVCFIAGPALLDKFPKTSQKNN